MYPVGVPTTGWDSYLLSHYYLTQLDAHFKNNRKQTSECTLMCPCGVSPFSERKCLTFVYLCIS